MDTCIEFELNGQQVMVTCPPEQRLIDLLRNHFFLMGAKIGCGEGECGACTVLLDRKPVLACIMAVGVVQGRSLLTIEGLRKKPGFAILSQAFNDAGAVQCGFCTPGMIMSAYVLLEEYESPTSAQVQRAISGNLCRCTGYNMIVEAIGLATKRRGEEW